MSQIIMPAGSVEERAQRIRNLGAECTIMEVIGMHPDCFHQLFHQITCKSNFIVNLGLFR